MSCMITWAQKKFSLQPKKEMRLFLRSFFNWDFDFKISQFSQKVFMQISKM